MILRKQRENCPGWARREVVYFPERERSHDEG